MRASLVSLAVYLIAAALSGPAIAKPPLDYRDPPPDALPGVGPFQHLPAIDESPTVVVSIANDSNWRAATFDPVLTNACRLGDFASVPLNPMMVRFAVPGDDATAGKGALQIIPPDRRHLLVDLRRLAAPGETYYFEDASFPTCRVWVENLVRKRTLGTAGTSLPPEPAGALKKREAEIKSWPQKTTP
jgi:hypothetical protein